jgi:cob(I)alamin adenosyltransferase
MKIYTKTGDRGNTSLYDGSKVSKDNIIIDCIGDIDELNSEIGYILANMNLNDDRLAKYRRLLSDIQSQLFDLGALIAHPNNAKGKNITFDIDQLYTKELEVSIDEMTSQLPKLVNFILPGGSVQMATVHKSRTICRRAERKMVGLKTNGIEFEDNCLIYINRLSDFLFTLARFIGKLQQIPEVIYKRKK